MAGDRLTLFTTLALVWLPAAAETVAVDVTPGDPRNFVEVTAPNVAVPVAILTTTEFDATTVDKTTLRFGPGLAVPDSNYFALAEKDVDSDGDIDLEVVFPVGGTGLGCADDTAPLSGATAGGIPISGTAAVETNDCPACHPAPRDQTSEYYHLAEDTQLNVSESATSSATLDSDVSQGQLQFFGDGSFSYQPDPDYYGLDSFSFTRADSSSVTVSLSVTAVNDPPTGNTDQLSVANGFGLSRPAPGVLANDQDPDGDALTVVLEQDAANGSLTLNSDGSYEYQPGPGFAGTDSFSYRIDDGTGLSDEVEVRVGFPNVVLIMVDDMGQGDLQVYNPQSALVLPSIDQLAAAGMRFNHIHSPASVCAPTRYALMTGNHPYRGLRDQGVWKSLAQDTQILPGQQTIANVLQNAGYNTAFFGKLHNGGAFWHTDGSGYTSTFVDIDFTRPFDKGPTQFGFDYSFVIPAGLQAGPYAFFENDRLVRYDPLSGDYLAFSDNAVAQSLLVQVTNGQLFNGGKISLAGRAMDNYDSRNVGPVLAAQALEYLNARLDHNESTGDRQPFFMYLALPAPHTPNTPPDEFNVADPTSVAAGGGGIPVNNVTAVSTRTDMVYETDLVLAELVAQLDASGELANTMVIYTSDNGLSDSAPAGYTGIGERVDIGRDGVQHINAQGVDNGVPLRDQKRSVYEGGHRVPFIVRWGDGTPAGSSISPGSVNNEFAGLHDLMATFAAMTEQTLAGDQANDSYSLAAQFAGAASAPVRDQLIIQGGGGAGYFDRAFYQRDASGDLWKLVVHSDAVDHTLNIVAVELFNLTDDAGETTDLLADPGAQTQLNAMLADYLALIVQDRTVP